MATTALPILIDIYGPDAVVAAKRGAKEKLRAAQADLRSLHEWYNKVGDELNGMHFKKRPSYQAWLDEYTARHEEKYEKEIARLLWDLDFLNSFDHEGFRESHPSVLQKGVTDEQILRAKEVDIRSLVPVNRALTTCLWHDDKRPSMHIYKDNYGYCFACGKHADAIDFFMALHGGTFVEAVRRMAP